MAKVLRRAWKASPGSGVARRDRRGCEYEAYVPDSLSDRTFRLDGDVAADVSEAEAAIADLNRSAVVLIDTEALARILLRAESVASSHIEGLVVGGRRLLHAEAARGMGVPPADVTAEEVLGNIDAMAWAVGSLGGASSHVEVDDLLEIHRCLLEGTRLAGHAGKIRTTQTWIGGSSYNPCSAAFVPPPPELVHGLLEDLCGFCNDDSLPAVAHAALAHAQFETIHPFVDGNGRTGRALIHVVLRRRGLAPRVVPPVSLVLATRSNDYIEGLTATRYRGRADSSSAHEGINRWVATFAAACIRSVQDAFAFERRIADIQERWGQQAASPRADSAAALLMASLPGVPVITATSAAELIDRSFQATNQAIARLEQAGILKQITVGRRNRAFEATDVVDAFTDLERQLASRVGDTRSAGPSRPAPRRR